MSYHGHIKNGMVVLELSARPPEGAKVRVEVLPKESPAGIDPEMLRKWRGRGRLPGNLSVDDYLRQVRDSHADRLLARDRGFLRDYFSKLTVLRP